MLGAPLHDARPLVADVSVEALPTQRYRLLLRVAGASGRAERALELAGCEEVARAAVLLIATALQTSALDGDDLGADAEADDAEETFEPPALAHEVELPSEPSGEEGEEGAAPTAAPRPPTAAAPAEALPEPAGASPSWWLRLGASLDVASLPAVTGGPFVGFGVHGTRWRSYLDLRYFLPREQTDPWTAQHTQHTLYAAAVGSSFGWAVRRAVLGPALELELGTLRARVLGEFGDGSAHSAWVALLGGAHAQVALRDRVALALDVMLGVPLRRPTFVVADQPSFYQTGALTARFALGVQVQL